MQLRTLIPAVLLLTSLPAGAAAQDAASVVAAASKAMAVDTLNSITYSGTARNGAFGQSKAIGEPMGAVNVTQITQYADDQLRTGSGTDRPGLPRDRADSAAQRAGRAAAAGGRVQPEHYGRAGRQQLGAGAQHLDDAVGIPRECGGEQGDGRQQGGVQLVSFTPPNVKSPSGQTYTVTGHINKANQVTKVETTVDNAVVGDLPVEFEYSNYQNMNVGADPNRAASGRPADVRRQHHGGHAESTEPHRAADRAAASRPGGGAAPPAGPGGRGAGAPPAGGPPAAAGPPPVEKIGEGVFKIGGNYTSIAVDMGIILVIESGQNDARGQAVMAAAKQAIPNKQIRFVVNSHPHFDHAGGLGARSRKAAPSSPIATTSRCWSGSSPAHGR